MKVVLLCAGYATRLYPLTFNQPKPLLPIAGRPLLEWVLDRVQALDAVEQVFVVTNHKFAPHFEKWALSRGPAAKSSAGADGSVVPGPFWPLEVIDDQTTSDEDRLGAIGDLRFVIRQKNIGPEEDLLVIAGDNFFDFDLRTLIQFSEAKRPHPVIAVYDVGDFELAKQYGLVRLDDSGRVLEFLEKPKDPPVTLASCGIYWLPASSGVLLDRYLSGGHNSDQPGHFMQWLAENGKLFAVPLKGHWLDIGDRASYEKASKYGHSREGGNQHADPR